MSEMAWLVPEGFSLVGALLLVVSAGFTSFVSAAMGIGGGLLLLLIMVNIMPLAALIPVHGLVQLGSNTNRMLMTRAHIQWSIVSWFALGALLAAVISIFVIVQLPVSIIQLAIGVFVLLMVWGIKPKKRELTSSARVLSGLITTFLSMFVGATGPLVAALIHVQRAEKLAIVSTFSTCMTIQHGLKILVFGGLGFVFIEWLPLVFAMIAAGAIGTWVGVRVLHSLSADMFQWLFKGIMTILALRALYSGLFT